MLDKLDMLGVVAEDLLPGLSIMSLYPDEEEASAEAGRFDGKSVALP